MKQIRHIVDTIVAGVRRDMRVRWGLSAGASVLLSAGVLGIGGGLVPNPLQASAAPHVLLAQSQAEGLVIVDMSTTTVAQIIESLPQAERYELMLYNSGADQALKGAGQYTVFVPANNYFDYLPKGTIAGLSRQETYDLALKHMVGRTLPMQESLNGDVPTLGQNTVSFEVKASEQKVSVDGAQVLKAYKAQNGMVYLINKVLLPSAN